MRIYDKTEPPLEVHTYEEIVAWVRKELQSTQDRSDDFIASLVVQQVTEALEAAAKICDTTSDYWVECEGDYSMIRASESAKIANKIRKSLVLLSKSKE